MAKQDLALVKESDLSLVESNSLNANQLQQILRRTPSQYIKERPAKGGGTWRYVTGGYVKKCLNLMFGWDWDFEVVRDAVMSGQVVVLGKLTCRSNGRTITKMQYGHKDIVNKKGTDTPLDIGNDFKAACTDSLKKCASEIGIAADIYNAEDFREVQVQSEEIDLAELLELYEMKKEALNEKERWWVETVLNEKDKKNYSRVKEKLSAL